MLRKLIKYTLIASVVFLLGYKSVYFRKLSSFQQAGKENFDAVSFTDKLVAERFPARLDSAVDLNELIHAVETDPANAFARYFNAIDIGNSRYCIIKTTATVASIAEDRIMLQVNHADSLLSLQLETEYIYGNAIRDASELVDIKDFVNTMDLNHISEELNKMVRTTILPPFKKQVKTGDKVEVTAAMEINREHIRFNQQKLIPVRLKIISW
ncbi:MAG TPA: DUF2291 domain-containing protein [Chitinophagaceae bacterium]